MLHNLQSISLKSEFLRNSKKSCSLGCFLEHFFESFFKKYLFSNNENSLIDNKKQGITDLITQNYKRAIQRSITAGININECELNTSFIDSVLRITVLKKIIIIRSREAKRQEKK